jgi:hypothetical protein
MFQGQLLQSEGTAARRQVYLHLVDAADGMTPETGEASGQPQVSKNGGSWTNTTNTLVAIGNGRYYVELTATELNTLGNVQVRYKSGNTAEAVAGAQVVINSPFVALATQASVDAMDDYIDTEIAAIKAKTDNLPASPAAVSDIPSAATVAAAVWAYVVEGSYTALGFLRLFMAALCNKSTGFGTGTWIFKDAADTKPRLTVTGDGIGNRTSVTTDVS